MSGFLSMKRRSKKPAYSVYVLIEEQQPLIDYAGLTGISGLILQAHLINLDGLLGHIMSYQLNVDI